MATIATRSGMLQRAFILEDMGRHTLRRPGALYFLVILADRDRRSTRSKFSSEKEPKTSCYTVAGVVRCTDSLQSFHCITWSRPDLHGFGPITIRPLAASNSG